MDVAYVNPFINATLNVFKTMLNMEVKQGKPLLKTESKYTYDISGIIGLSGSAQGSIALSFPKMMALKIVSQLIETELKVVGAELSDGIGELTNIVAGNAKAELAATSKHTLSISLPNVVIGKNHAIIRPSQHPGIMVPFSCKLGDFSMEVSLKTE